MKEFYRVMLGKGSMFAQECREQGFIGADFDIHQDLTDQLPDDWREFNKKFIPIFLQANPDKSKIAAGLCCGFLWSICKKIQIGDTILSPDGRGKYYVGEVQSEYRYVPGANQPHQRQVHWLDETIDRAEMSEALRRSTGSIGTVSQISKYREELQGLIKGEPLPTLISTDDTVEDPPYLPLKSTWRTFLLQTGTKRHSARDMTFIKKKIILDNSFLRTPAPLTFSL